MNEERKRSGSSGESMVRRRLEEAAAKRKKRRRLITMIAAECIALVFIFGYAYVARQLNKIQRPDNFKISELETNELTVNTVETMKGYWTIAIFGVDARDHAINKSTNADVNMICNINRDTGEIKLVSVFRDTYLNISEGGSYNKLNQAYFIGGPEQAIGTLNRNLDLQINDYMTFNWKAVADAINVLGGVDIELSDAEFYYINGFITETVEATGIGSKHLTHAGMNHLDGVQAVAYARLRKMDTDFARTERQRKVIAKAFEKVKSADFKTLNTLIGTVFPQVSTSIWVDDLVSNAKNISKFHLGETTGFPQARGDVSMGKKGAVVVPQTLETNVVKLHEFLFGDSEYTPSKTVKNISAKIAADTGMYKEGQYIDHVNTEGVIQKPKATAAAATEAEETTKAEQESSESESETISKTTEAETDEFGNPLESETNPTTSETPGMRPIETDADGNLIDPAERPGTSFHPTKPTESESVTKPGSTTETTSGVTTRPGSTTETTSGVTTRPGSTTETTSGVTTKPGSTTETTSGVTTKPGSTTETTSGVTTRPGNTTQPTAGVTTKPGSTTETTAAGVTTKPGSSSTPGTTTDKVPGSSSGNGVVSAPGSSTSGTSTSTVPGSYVTAPTAPTAGSGVSGTVAAPGQ